MIEVSPHVYKETPGKGGPRVLSNAEICELAKNPKFREAVDVIDKVQNGGKPSAVKMIVHKQLVRDLVADRHAKEQAEIIKRAMMKQEGKLDIPEDRAKQLSREQALNNNPDLEPIKKKAWSYKGQTRHG